MSNTPFTLRELAPGVHAMETEFWGKGLNLYLFKGERRTLLCDTGPAGMATELVLPTLERAGLLKDGIDFILNAHSHIDHCGGNAELLARFPHATIMASVNELEYIAEPEKGYDDIYNRWAPLFDFGEEFHQESVGLAGQGIMPDLGLQGGEEIKLGGLTLEVVNLYGHSFADIGLYCDQHHLLFSGEALLASGARGEDGELVAPPYYESAAYYDKALSTAERYEAAILCTSHFGVLEGVEIQDHIAESRAYFDDYDRNVQDVVCSHDGLTAEQVARTFAEKHSPFDFRLETMQLVSTHLEYLVQRGRIVRDGELYRCDT